MVLLEKLDVNCKYILTVAFFVNLFTHSILEHEVKARGVLLLVLWSQSWHALIKHIEVFEDMVTPFSVIADIIVKPLTAEVHMLICPQGGHQL